MNPCRTASIRRPNTLIAHLRSVWIRRVVPTVCPVFYLGDKSAACRPAECRWTERGVLVSLPACYQGKTQVHSGVSLQGRQFGSGWSGLRPNMWVVVIGYGQFQGFCLIYIVVVIIVLVDMAMARALSFFFMSFECYFWAPTDDQWSTKEDS